MGTQGTRWLWLVALVFPLAHPAAADPPAPASTPPPDPGASPPPDPLAAGTTLRLALLDVAPQPEQDEEVATFIAETVHSALLNDRRFITFSRESVAEARAQYEGNITFLEPEGDSKDEARLGVADPGLTYAQACLTGRALGAQRILLLGGYDAGVRRILDESEFRRDRGQVRRHEGRNDPANHKGPQPMHQAWVAASMIVMDTSSCALGEKAVVRATRDSFQSEAEAREGARNDFAPAVQETLQRLFPVHALITAVGRDAGRHGGEMDHGARHGVREGQYFAVHRAGRVVGHVYVDDVDEDSAHVSLVQGTSRLAPRDRLVEAGTVRVWEAGVSTTPNLLDRRNAGDAFGMAVAAHVMLYEPVSAGMYGLMLERLALPDFQRWRAGVEYGRQVRILPRRLFAYARLGVGILWASQIFRHAEGMYFDDGVTRYDGGTARSFEILNAVGVKATLGAGLVLHLSTSYPLVIDGSNWALHSDPKLTARDEIVVYPKPHRALPTLTLGAGWRF